MLFVTSLYAISEFVVLHPDGRFLSGHVYFK